MSLSQTIIRSLLLVTVFVVVGCSSYGLRNSVGNVGSTGCTDCKKPTIKPPLEYHSEEGVPYTTKLTYGQVCVDSKRLGKEYCFPCYNVEKGGCESAMQDLIDKAILCSASVGPAVQNMPAYQPAPQVSYSPMPQQVPQYIPAPQAQYPSTYPNFSR